MLFTNRPIKTRFPYAFTTELLKLANNINSLAHFSIGTLSSIQDGLQQLDCIRFQVLFHSAIRGSFNLSLTVLVHYRCLYVFSLTRWSWRIHTGFHVSHATLENPRSYSSFEYGAITLYGKAFQLVSPTKVIFYFFQI